MDSLALTCPSPALLAVSFVVVALACPLLKVIAGAFVVAHGALACSLLEGIAIVAVLGAMD